MVMKKGKGLVVVIAILVLVAIGFGIAQKTADTKAQEQATAILADYQQICNIEYSKVKTSLLSPGFTIDDMKVKSPFFDAKIGKMIVSKYVEGPEITDADGNVRNIPSAMDICIESLRIPVAQNLQKMAANPMFAPTMQGPEMEQMKQVLADLGISEEIVVNYDASYKMNVNEKTYDMTISFGIENLMDIEEEVKISNIDIVKLASMPQAMGLGIMGLDPAAIGANMPAQDMMASIMDIAFDSASIKLVNKSVIDKVIAMISKQAGQPAEQIKQMFALQVTTGIPAEAPEFFRQLSMAALELVNGDRDAITVKMAPATPVKVMEFSTMGSSLDMFERLNVTVE